MRREDVTLFHIRKSQGERANRRGDGRGRRNRGGQVTSNRAVSCGGAGWQSAVCSSLQVQTNDGKLAKAPWTWTLSLQTAASYLCGGWGLVCLLESDLSHSAFGPSWSFLLLHVISDITLRNMSVCANTIVNSDT